MKDRKKPEKFLPPHGMPSDGCEFAFSSRVPPKALTIKIPYTSWNSQLLDDWGLAPFSEENRRDLLEMAEDRHDRRATIITSQLPVEHWHDALEHPTLAEATLAAGGSRRPRSPW